MEQLPILVEDLAIRDLSNAVCVATCKFTNDQFAAAFDPDENPAPAKLARQMTSFGQAYQQLDAAYAIQQKRAETADIAALDQEGDSLVTALRAMLDAALRMAFDPQRQQQGQYLNEMVRKYRIDTQENMISEWSKVEQLTGEYQADAQARQYGQQLGIDALMQRLAQIAADIRQLMSQRSAAAPDQGAMKQARLAIYPEYRTLIYLLNAFCATSDEPESYAALIRALNDNIDYTRRHAMHRKQKPDDPQPDDQGGSDVTPVTPEQ